MDSSNFTASLFNVVFTPDNRSLHLEINSYTSIAGNVTAELQVIAYGFKALTKSLDPCEMKTQGLGGLCPMRAGPLNFTPTISIDEDVINKIPSIAYTVPDLDGQVKVIINSTDTGDTIACLEANLSNDQTVYQKGVEWAVAVIAGLGLVASAITSGLGHSNTAAHVAANALSLFGFFQAQAMIGATSVHMPPIVESWTQNFQWSIGIIHVSFIETIATWYQRATGGTPSTLLSTLSTTSVLVEKRWVQDSFDMLRRGMSYLAEREETSVSKSKIETISGLARVAFKGNMEVTNIFLTGLIWFSVFVVLVIMGVGAFKGICELLAKHGKISPDKFHDFRNGWKVILRGILFRLILIGWAQMCVLCLWEFTVHDSAAEIVLAIIMFFSMLGVLGWASFKVIQLAKRSIAMHKNPAYILYSDPTCLNKWGFLYVQYRATAYYFVIPVLGYLLIKGMFIAFGQNHSVVQAVALLIIEAAFLVAVSVIRPWMDKKTNIFNISIAAVNFLNSVFLLVFSDVFNQPGMVTGVMGVVFFVINVIFAFVLLVLVLIASIYAMVSKNPDMRYQPMRDDRASFIKSNTELNTELDALANTARGGEMELKSTAYHPTYEDESNSFSSGNGASITNNRTQHDGNRVPPSPVDPSVPLFPSSHGPPPSYDSNGYNDITRTGSPAHMGDFNPSAALAAHNFRQQNNSSPWQRGAGYDH
ncbi:Flavin carrier protein 2 [Talaromyces islandicus]|uniref:Flavin carrier protein 2 n=1 Tax=Talaromyces islandicus TaxID=28573 RepID=A0A0U1LVQ6_TALIS|nr:Flavin carrier protein 2 [Talaromyces islandicus]